MPPPRVSGRRRARPRVRTLVVGRPGRWPAGGYVGSMEAPVVRRLGPWLATGLFGLAMASIFPTILTYAERVMPVTGRVASLFVVGAALGEMLVPLLVATLFKLDPSWFVVANLATSAAQLAAFLAAWRLGCRLTKGNTSRATAASSSIELQRSPQSDS